MLEVHRCVLYVTCGSVINLKVSVIKIISTGFFPSQPGSPINSTNLCVKPRTWRCKKRDRINSGSFTLKDIYDFLGLCTCSESRHTGQISRGNRMRANLNLGPTQLAATPEIF